MKRFVMHYLRMLCLFAIISSQTQTFASGFQLWEQDGASIGSYHAGYAAIAQDASTAFYNPAGITRFKNQQVVFGAAAVMPAFKYQGAVSVGEFVGPTLISQNFQNVTAQGGTFNMVPNLHYVAPVSEGVGFGFSIAAPFGLKIDYGRDTALRYASTFTSMTVVDISPALAFKVTDKGSLGAGFDIQKVNAELDSISMLTPVGGNTDTQSINRVTGTGYGCHVGGLYEFTPETRVGISYHSQVVHHLNGPSKFYGPIADLINDGPVETSHITTNITLPAYTALSVYHRPFSQVGIMGSAILTEWNVFNSLTLNNIAGANIDPVTLLPVPDTGIKVSIPNYFHNTWNISLGAEYFATEAIILRSGIGYDQSPVPNAYRNAQLPDHHRYVIAFGSHFQATKTIGLDVGWMHSFIKQARVNPPAQITGGQITTTNGRVSGGADVISGQLTWDIL